MRTTNEVAYAGWGMAEWTTALLEGLAGLRDADSQMREMSVSPRWTATPVKDVRVVTRYAASDACFAYRMECDQATHTLSLTYTGSGKTGRFSVLLPEGWKAKSLTVDGQRVPFELVPVEASRYVNFDGSIAGLKKAVIACE